MDFSLSEEQVLLRDSVGKYVRDTCDVERHRKLSGTALGFDPAAWQQFAELGWLAVPFSEALGGIGGGAVDLMVMCEAFGKGLVREPYLHTVVTCGGLLQRAGSHQQQRQYLPAIMDGSAQWAFAFAEQCGGYDLTRLTTTARQDGSDYILDGVKRAVLNGHCASYLIVTTQASSGVTLWLVDALAEGVTRQDFVALDGSRGADVHFSGVRLEPAQRLGETGQGMAALVSALDLAIVAMGAEALGSMLALLDATVAYTKTRQQFGQPISQFQALQHRMADMYMGVEETRSLVLNAAMLMDEGNPDAAQACAGLKVKLAQAGRCVAQEAVQLHGGIGMTDELGVSHHYKRLMVLSRLYGDEAWHLQRFADLTADHVA
ncbi:MAG: acyl-CoA dehydrogenase family protein [Halioglobus sp.]|nr:acyl-CoA dehydrogenase family protein [Halioglobus sp.]